MLSNVLNNLCFKKQKIKSALKFIIINDNKYQYLMSYFVYILIHTCIVLNIVTTIYQYIISFESKFRV